MVKHTVFYPVQCKAEHTVTQYNQRKRGHPRGVPYAEMLVEVTTDSGDEIMEIRCMGTAMDR